MHFLLSLFLPPLTDRLGIAGLLGLIIHNDRRYGFFYAIGDGEEAGGSGEVTILEVTEFDEDGQPAAFELVMDDAIAAEVYEDFKVATKDLYDFQ